MEDWAVDVEIHMTFVILMLKLIFAYFINYSERYIMS